MKTEHPDVTFVYGRAAMKCDVLVNGNPLPRVHRVEVADAVVIDANEESDHPDSVDALRRMADENAPLTVHFYEHDGDGIVTEFVDGEEQLVSESQTFREWSVEYAHE